MRAFIALASLVACSIIGCGGSGEFRPAKDGASYPPMRAAYRIREVGVGCEKIGSVDGETIEQVAETTAEHGGTHYIVRVDETEDLGYRSTVSRGPFNTVNVNTAKVRERWISATAYNCL